MSSHEPKLTSKQVFETWQALTEAHAKTGQLLLEMLAHPDMTMDMVEAHVKSFRDTRAHLRKTHQTMVNYFEKRREHKYLSIVAGWRP